MKHLIIFVGLLLMVPLCSASNKIDSLKNIIAKEQSDLNKINQLIQLSELYNGQKDYDNCIVYSYQALELIEHGQFNLNNELLPYFLIGRSYYYKSEFDSSILILETGIEKLGKYGKDNDVTLKLYNVLGSAYNRKSEYRKSINSFTKGIEIGESISEKYILGSLYNNIGNIYGDIDQYEKAIEYHRKSMALDREIGDTLGIAASMLNIGDVLMQQNKLDEAIAILIDAVNIYKEKDNEKGITDGLINLGVVNKTAGNIERAIEYYKEALSYSEQNNLKKEEAAILQNLGNIYGNQGDHAKAVSYQLQARNLYEELGIKKSVGEVMLNIGLEYFEAGNLSKSVEYLTESLSLAEAIESPYDVANANMELGNTLSEWGKFQQAQTFLLRGKEKAKEAGSIFLEMYADLYISQHYERQGQFKESLVYFQSYKKSSDKLTNKQNKDQLNKIQSQFDWELQENEMKVLNQENEINEIKLKNAFLTRNYLLGIAILLLAIALGLIWSNRVISKEKKKTDELLLNILPAETARELKSKGTVDARKFSNVTVLFTDFKEFSKLTESIDPEILVKSIDVYFKKFDEITTKFGLEKIKTIGDSYMCAGGLPTHTITHPNDVVNAAKEMIAFVLERKKLASELLSFDIRIGLNTGPVIAGIVGIKKWQYDIWGNTVNIAARMESNSIAGKINVSEKTYNEIKDEIKCTYRGEFEVKNQGLYKMYFVD